VRLAIASVSSERKSRHTPPGSRATATASLLNPSEQWDGAPPTGHCLEAPHGSLSTGPTAGPLNIQVLLNIKCAEPAPAQLLLPCALPGGGFAPRGGGPPRLHLLRRASLAGAGLGTHSGPKALSRGWEHPWGCLGAGWFRRDQPRRPAACRLVRDGVLDPRPIPGCPRCWPRGKGAAGCAVDSRFRAHRFSFTELRGRRSVAPTATRVARARFTAQL